MLATILGLASPPFRKEEMACLYANFAIILEAASVIKFYNCCLFLSFVSELFLCVYLMHVKTHYSPQSTFVLPK